MVHDISSPIFAPIITLVIWTIVMLFWMAGLRLPTIQRLKLPTTAGQRTADLARQMPAKIQWSADNYNHLMEQPTLFYATALCAAMMGMGDGLNLTLAWAYVGLRIAHSLVHATVNIVLLRFGLFFLSTLALLWMAINLGLQFI